jgi:hypothetical protein
MSKTNEQKSQEREKRFAKRKEALLRDMRADVAKLRKIIRRKAAAGKACLTA